MFDTIMEMEDDAEETQLPTPTREQVVDAFRVFTNKGYKSPDDLPLNDPEVITANELLDAWGEEQRAKAKEIGTKEAEHEYTLSRSTVHVDAGFSDPDYLDEVATWLGTEDLPDAKEAGLTQIADKINAKIEEINQKLE